MRRLTILIALLVTATAADAQILKIPAPYVTASGTAAGSITFPTGSALRTGTTSGDTLSLSAYDVDGAAYSTLLTLTAGNTPTLTAGVPLYLPVGSAAAPALAFTGETNTGFYKPSAGAVSLSLLGAVYAYFNGNIAVAANSSFNFSGTNDNASAASDLRLFRDSAATLQLGADAEGVVTPQMLKASDRITSDGVGADLILAGGRNRGASAGGSVIIQSAPAAGAGVAGTLATRLTIDSTGAATFTGPIATSTDTYPPMGVTRTGATGNALYGVQRWIARTTNASSDGFGPELIFSLTDDGSTAVTLGTIGYSRAGADNTGDFVVLPATGGTQAEKFRVASTGLATFYGDMTRQGANAQKLTISQATVLCTIATDTNCTGRGTATIAVTNLIPAGSLVVGVTVRVTTILAGSDGIATWALGHAGDTDAWGAGLALAANTTNSIADFTATSPGYFTSATSVTLTGTGGKLIDSGAVRVTVHYISLTAATS